MNTTKVKVKAKPAPAEAYENHMEGSRKGKVHKLYDEQGSDAAWTLGLRLGLKQGTLRTWFANWRGAGAAAKASPAKKARAAAIAA